MKVREALEGKKLWSVQECLSVLLVTVDPVVDPAAYPAPPVAVV